MIPHDDDDRLSEDDLIDEVIGGPDDAVLMGWLIVAKYAGLDEATSIVQSCSDNMDMVTQLGLAEAMREFAVQRLRGEAVDE